MSNTFKIGDRVSFDDDLERGEGTLVQREGECWLVKVDGWEAKKRGHDGARSDGRFGRWWVDSRCLTLLSALPDATGTTVAPEFTVNPGGGKKQTGNKSTSNQVPAAFIYALSKHMDIGAVKYGFGNWCKGLTEAQALESIRRHSDKRRAGENIDPDTGSDHYLAIAANAMMAWCLSQCGRLTDDRAQVFIDVLVKP